MKDGPQSFVAEATTEIENMHKRQQIGRSSDQDLDGELDPVRRASRDQQAEHGQEIEGAAGHEDDFLPCKIRDRLRPVDLRKDRGPVLSAVELRDRRRYFP